MSNLEYKPIYRRHLPHHQPPDGVEFYAPGSRRGIVFFFQGADAFDERTVILKGLDPQTVYQIESGDRALSARYTGQQLMTDGIAIANDASNPSAIVTIK